MHRLTAEHKVDLDQLAAATRSRADLPRYRKAIVLRAIEEARLGLVGFQARRRYNGWGSWCAEFARWLYGHSGAYADPAIVDEFAKVVTSSELEALFAKHGSWVEKEAITAQTVKPGDYLPLDLNANGSPDHSTIVVYVASDKRRVYTVDGNNEHGREGSRVSLKVRPYMRKDDSVHPSIDGVGKAWPPARHPKPAGQ